VHEGEGIVTLDTPYPTDLSLTAPMPGFPADSGVEPVNVMVNESSENGSVAPNKVSTTIRGSVDHPHEAIQARRFGDLYGGGVIDFGNVTPGIEGYFIKQGADIKTPFSLKNLSGTGNVKNIFREIKSNARVIQKHESLPQSDAMSLPLGTSQNAVIHVNCPQFSAQEIISFVEGSKPNIFQSNVFKEILIDTNSGVVVIDAAKNASLRK
jgi:hypothetical protein